MYMMSFLGTFLGYEVWQFSSGGLSRWTFSNLRTALGGESGNIISDTKHLLPPRM